MTAQETRRATIFVRGQVQGVGFRWWTRARALELGLVGFARNMVDGRVEVCAQGQPAAVEALITLLREWPSQSRPSRIGRRPGRQSEGRDRRVYRALIRIRSVM